MMLLSENWRFHYGDVPEAWYAGYDDSDWERVFVPHDYAVTAPFEEHYASGAGYLRGGTAWYRVRFVLPESVRGQSVKLIFDGVYKNSQVWCNSSYLGKVPGGYTPFFYSITHCVKFGGENVLCVRVSHEEISDSRWYTGSGILRPVGIVTEPEVHPAAGGVFFSAQEIRLQDEDKDQNRNPASLTQPLTGEDAMLRLRVRLQNDSDRNRMVTLRAWLSGTDEQVFPAPDVLVPARGEQMAELTGVLHKPRLWSPTHPQCYTLFLDVYDSVDGPHEDEPAEGSAGQLTESVTKIPVGIRSLVFDPDHGFFLNGIPTKLKGVCVHEDAGCLGSAVPREVWERRLELLKDCGCNAIRMSHNPHADALYGLCDEMGFLVMDEAFDEWENPKNKWWQGHNVYPPRHQGSYADFPTWHDRELRAMVRRGRNHPSVILWSIGNEIDYPNDPYCHPMFASMTGNNDANKPETEQQYDPYKPNMERLAVIARELADIVREEDDTREVTLAAAYPELSTQIGFIDAIRVVGYNYRERCYEQDHLRFPDKVFFGSENGHEEDAWQAVTSHAYICGQFLWTGIDYLGEAKGWPVHGSPAGLLTTAGFPKERYFARQKLWGAEHSGESAEDCREKSTEKSTEESAEATSDPAVLLIEAPADIRAARWVPRRARTDRNAAKEWARRTGENGFVEQILLCLTDGEGHPVRDGDRMVEVRVEGAGELAGLDNGDLSDNTPYSSPCRHTLHGELAVYVRRTGPGRIQVRVVHRS